MKKRMNMGRWKGFSKGTRYFDDHGKKIIKFPDEREKESLRRLTREEMEEYRLSLLKDEK